jgi:PDZ domain-containing protein
MFALSIYDKLSPGPLTGGAAIAGTGTISPTGAVGPIGGIREKLYGAEEGGAKWFLAPKDNCAEVVDHVPDGLRVIKVGSFDDGLAAVKAIAAGAGDGLPRC